MLKPFKYGLLEFVFEKGHRDVLSHNDGCYAEFKVISWILWKVNPSIIPKCLTIFGNTETPEFKQNFQEIHFDAQVTHEYCEKSAHE